MTPSSSRHQHGRQHLHGQPCHTAPEEVSVGHLGKCGHCTAEQLLPPTHPLPAHRTIALKQKKAQTKQTCPPIHPKKAHTQRPDTSSCPMCVPEQPCRTAIASAVRSSHPSGSKSPKIEFRGEHTTQGRGCPGPQKISDAPCRPSLPLREYVVEFNARPTQQPRTVHIAAATPKATSMQARYQV